jgi:hypothetical protein
MDLALEMVSKLPADLFFHYGLHLIPNFRSFIKSKGLEMNPSDFFDSNLYSIPELKEIILEKARAADVRVFFQDKPYLGQPIYELKKRDLYSLEGLEEIIYEKVKGLSPGLFFNYRIDEIERFAELAKEKASLLDGVQFFRKVPFSDPLFKEIALKKAREIDGRSFATWSLFSKFNFSEFPELFEALGLANSPYFKSKEFVPASLDILSSSLRKLGHFEAAFCIEKLK